MEWVLVALVVLGIWIYSRSRSLNGAHGVESRRPDRQISREDLAGVKRAADEDVTEFGEELQRLDSDLGGRELDEGTRADYQRALDAYEDAKASAAAVTSGDEIRHVTEILGDGRYDVACVRARVEGKPLPARRPPCFFNPQHGPSSITVRWTPPGGTEREVAVCASDANRLARGEDPAVRMMRVGDRWVPFFGGHRSSCFPVLVDPDAINNGAGHARGQAMRCGWMPTGGEGAGLGGNTAGFGGGG